jgi:hypothetical protein
MNMNKGVVVVEDIFNGCEFYELDNTFIYSYLHGIMLLYMSP